MNELLVRNSMHSICCFICLQLLADGRRAIYFSDLISIFVQLLLISQQMNVCTPGGNERTCNSSKSFILKVGVISLVHLKKCKWNSLNILEDGKKTTWLCMMLMAPDCGLKSQNSVSVDQCFPLLPYHFFNNSSIKSRTQRPQGGLCVYVATCMSVRLH